MGDIKETYHYDSMQDRLYVKREQDCSDIVEDIARLKQVTDGRSDLGMGYHIGRIPGIIIEQYCREVGVTFQDFINDDTHIKRIMNNPDYKKFRIFEGRM